MKAYAVALTSLAYVSTTVIVEVEDEQADEDGFLLDEVSIGDLAMQQAFDGNVTWEYDGVDDDDIEVASITRTWSES